ncbi:unnamed protein product, partial [Linum tenue]
MPIPIKINRRIIVVVGHSSSDSHCNRHGVLKPAIENQLVWFSLGCLNPRQEHLMNKGGLVAALTM